MTTQLAPAWIFRGVDNNGNSLVGGQLYTYIAGTTTPQATYTDSTGLVPNTNPVILNSRGEAFVWLTSGQFYKFALYDSAGNLIQSEDNISAPFSGTGSLIPLITNTYNIGSPSFTWANGYFGTALYVGGVQVPTTQALLGAILYPQSAAELAASITPSNYARQNTPIYDMSRYGIQPNGSDNTAIVQAVFNMMKVTGGTMVFPYGDWSFYLDISGQTNLPIVIDGTGSTFRCYTTAPTQSAVVFCNNGTTAVTVAGNHVQCTTWYGSNIEFRECTFIAKKYSGGATAGDLNTAVAIYGSGVKFWNCNFEFGKIAAFYGDYAQYCEFWSCGFYLSSYSPTSAGCVLDSHSNAASSNEVTFMRCYFQANTNGAWVKGCYQVRFYGCNFQGNGAVTGGGSGTGCLILDLDTPGGATVGTVINGCWWEINTVPSILGSSTVGTTIDGCLFLTSSGAITFPTNCYTLTFVNNHVFGGTLNVNLTHSTADACQITYRGNDANLVLNTFSIANATSKNLDIHYQGSYTGTLTGCTTTPTATVNFTIDGDSVDLHIPTLTATSNSTACTITGAPTLIRPVSTWFSCGYWEDNTAGVAGNSTFDNTGTLTLIKNNSTTGFTAAGTKGTLQNLIRYPLFV